MVVLSKEEAIKSIIESDTGLMKYVNLEKTGQTLQTRIPLYISSLPLSLDNVTGCPGLGEDNVKILAEAGYTETEIADLAEQGVIGPLQ